MMFIPSRRANSKRDLADDRRTAVPYDEMQQAAGKGTLFFYLMVLAIFLVACLPSLLKQGMFMDGVCYAAIARNLSVGLGSFWQPHFTQTMFPVFHENPPLALWLQSLLFQGLGDSGVVERFYSLVSMILVGLLVVGIWRKVTGEMATAWFPLLVLLGFPVIPWAARNNMLENTMSVFVCMTVWLYWVALDKRQRIFVVLGGGCLFLGLLSKGPVALFALATPFCIWLFTNRLSGKQCLWDSALLTLGVLLPFGVLYLLSAGARHFLNDYVTSQLFPSVTGMREAAESRFTIIEQFLEQALIPGAVLLLGAWILLRSKKIPNGFALYRRDSLAFFALSLCGVLPIVLSMKQHGYYILPVYPFLAIALALPFQPYLRMLMEKVGAAPRMQAGLSTGAGGLMILALLFTLTQVGEIRKDREMVQLVLACNQYLPQNQIIGMDPGLSTNWPLRAYFARLKNISLDGNPQARHRYYLSTQQDAASTVGKGYFLLENIGNYALLEKGDR